MLRLYSAKSAFGVRCASPFATKAESMLRISGADFERIDASPVNGPRKKLPYMVTPDGETISDSRNIQLYLEQHHGLRLAPCAVDTLVRRLVEEHLYFAQVYARWVHHAPRVRDEFFAEVPPVLRSIVFALVRRQVRGALHGQGIGRRPEAEIIELVHEDLDALERALGKARFFGGDELAAADLSAHGLLDQVLSSDLDDAVHAAMREHAALNEYHRRVDDAVWGAGSQRQPIRQAS